MSEERQDKKKLSATYLDNLIHQAKNACAAIDDRTKELVFELFKKLEAIAVFGEDERRELWFSVPRGSIEEFGDYKEYLEYGEVESREEFEEIWLSEYPDVRKWYQMITVVYKDIYSVFYDNKLVLQIQPEQQEHCPFEKSELAGWLLRFVEKAIIDLRSNKYNDHVKKNLPYRKRIGKILREDFWNIFPEGKEEYLKDIDPKEVKRFVDLIKKQQEDKLLSRLPEMTADMFFDFCRLGYEANNYEGIEKSTSKEMYRKHADGRDDGLLDLDGSSAAAFDTWYHDKTNYGGHPWEVCRGGNSTHISLYACNDEKGWWLRLAGSSLWRSVETVKFYLALVDQGNPVVLLEGVEIAAMLTGTDHIGIVPEGTFPRYCGSLFPDEKILDFMNLPFERTEQVEKAAIWYPVPEVHLL